MIDEPERYPYIERDPTVGVVTLAPLLPIQLIGSKTVSVLGLLDTGASVNVLPYGLGEEVGGIWERQTTSLALVGSLVGIEARLLLVRTRVGNFPVAPLVFAWARTDAVPVILGQANFFVEFDVCFHRSRSSFEVRPRLE